MDKELEIAKRLFDIGLLFDVVENVGLISTTFETIAAQEFVFCALNDLTIIDVLQDSFDAACLIGLRGVGFPHEYAELQEGYKKLAAFIYSGTFTVDSASLCASKLHFWQRYS